MKCKNNDKGFSLLEILVAVAILAVVVAPFLMAFLTSTRINASTKSQQRAKFAATNVMEDIRSMSVQDIISGAVTINCEGEEDADSVKDNEADLEPGIYLRQGGIYDGTYLYRTTQITDNGEEFIVDATLDPKGVTIAGSGDKATDYNKQEMAHIKGMSSVYDTFYELDADTDNSKFEQLSEKLLGSRDEDTIRSVYDTVNREIVINITDHDITDQDNDDNSITSKTDSDAEGGVYVTVQVFYTMPNAGGIEEVMTQPQVIYTSTTTTLEGIYLFYNPLYNGTFWRARETITINNDINHPCTIYLVKQTWPESGSEVKNFPFLEYCHYHDNNSREANYRVNVRLKENRSESKVAETYNKGDVITGLRTNVDSNHFTLSYANNSSGNYSNKCGDIDATDIVGLTGLSDLEVTDSVYHVVVEAYQLKGDDNERVNYAKVESTAQ